MEKKPEGYKSWLSKQHTRVCGTRVQVGYYSGIDEPEVGCPNCGEREDSKHLCQCPDEDRTAYLKEKTNELEAWLHKDDKTDCEIAYWIPKFIKCRGINNMEDLGKMFSRHFYNI